MNIDPARLAAGRKKRKSLLLGFCPIGKFVFSHEDALRQKKAVLAKLDEWKVRYCTIDSVLPDGMVRDQAHVAPVVRFFREKSIDALFVPHCNFGTEGAVGMIARELGVPVLLWGPRDEAPLEDGSRLRDSLCGMFASSKVIRKLHVPFTYVENCRVEDAQFRDGFSLFLRAAMVVKSMRRMRIGQVGVRVDFFWTTITNESELLEKFGIQVLPFDMADFLRGVKARAKKERAGYLEELAGLKKTWLEVEGMKGEEGILNSLAYRDELFRIGEENDLDAFSIKSFSSIPDELGAGIGIGEMMLQEWYPVGAESDLHGAVSSVLVEAAASKEQPSFFPEYTVRHPTNDNAVLLWHGVAPLSLRHPGAERVRIGAPWILKGLPASSPRFRLRDGPLTVCRFDGDTGEYRLGIGQGRTVPGPDTREFHAWMEVDDWPRWERQIMEGPYIHHCSAVYDHCADVLEEACRYIPHLRAERFDRLMQRG
jgi:L-fucose isomerase-like protein